MTIKILQDKKGPIISKHIYGHFAEHLGRCIYEGLYVGAESTIPNVNGMRTDVVDALKNLEIPVLRWPGGCFADEYHWKDGIGPKETRKTMVNTNWGGVTENNHFGTHEFFELVEQLGCEAYVNGNVGSGSVQEMQEWVEYITMPGESPMANLRRENGRDEPWKMTYFGVGNESWGCGGNMRPEYYADLYRRYQTFVKQYGEEKIYKIACGANVADYNWTDKVMELASTQMDGISLHYYSLTGAWEDKGPATNFKEEEWWSLLANAQHMDELITRHSTIMDQFDPEKKVDLIVDEWGTWLSVEPGTNPGFLYQQNTIRDAMVAALTFNIFHKHAERVHMANIAQTVNVLQAMILTEGEKMVKTPSYYVFELYKNHQEAEHLDAYGDKRETTSYTVSKKNNQVTISICNYAITEEDELEFSLPGLAGVADAQYIFGEKTDSFNDFDKAEEVSLTPFTAYSVGETLKVTVPPMSVTTLVVDLV